MTQRFVLAGLKELTSWCSNKECSFLTQRFVLAGLKELTSWCSNKECSFLTQRFVLAGLKELTSWCSNKECSFSLSLHRADSLASLYTFDEVRLFFSSFFFYLFAWGGCVGGVGGLSDNLATHRSKFIPLYCVAKDESLEMFNKSTIDITNRLFYMKTRKSIN